MTAGQVGESGPLVDFNMIQTQRTFLGLFGMLLVEDGHDGGNAPFLGYDLPFFPQFAQFRFLGEIFRPDLPGAYLGPLSFGNFALKVEADFG